MATPRAVIAGGGVAALEAALALRALAGERPLEVELVSPEPHFWFRPLSVVEPFRLGEVVRHELNALAAAAGADFTLGAVEGVDAARRLALTTVGEIPYDALLVAIGAVPVAAVPGALTFRGPADTDRLAALLGELETGAVRRVAFVLPHGAAWPLPAYELALLTAGRLRAREIEGVEVVLVTPEREPLALFGPVGSEAVRELFEERGIELVTSATALEVADGAVRLASGHVEADRVVALPLLRGPRLDGVPQTLDGFIPIDAHGRVRGLERVYAAGDITNFPVKQGGVATQVADAAAEAIAHALGLVSEPTPFRPVLRGLLLTGDRPHYLRHELGAAAGRSDAASPDPLWWPPAKVVGRHLVPFFVRLTGSVSPPEPAGGAIPVEIALDPAEPGPLVAAPPDEPPAAEQDTVAEVLTTDLLLVSPQDSLGDVAARLKARDTGSALVVVEDGRLVGILTSRDLLRAFAGRAHPAEARVREWMTAEPVAVDVSAGIAAAVATMSEHGIHHLPVVDRGRPVGMVGFRQAAAALQGRAIGLGL